MCPPEMDERVTGEEGENGGMLLGDMEWKVDESWRWVNRMSGG